MLNSTVPGRWFFTLALAAFLLASPWAFVDAQPPVSPKPPATTPPTPRPAGPPAPVEIQEAKPEVYFVRDKDGRLVPVPDFTYEEFKRLYDLDRKLAQETAPPNFVVQSLQVTGTAEDEFAELEVRVRWVIRGENWTRIPLRLGSAVLRDLPTYDGPGEHVVEADRGGGYSVWVRERDTSPHQLVLRVRVPLKRQGDEQSFTLPCPGATLSELDLSLPKSQLAVTLAGGGSILSNEPRATGGTRLKIAGLGENFQVAWRPRETNMQRLIGAVEATTSLSVRVDGPRRVSSDAKIKLRGIAPGVEVFRVRLPAGMEFSPAIEPGFTAMVAEKLPAAGGVKASQVVEVRLDARGATTAEIRLRAAHPETGATNPNERLETLGFEVLGVVRQAGTAEFTVNGDWTLQYGERLGVQPTELPEAARQQGVVARFEFFRQPCSLPIQVLPRKARTQIDPTYVMTVGAAQARLQATLNCRLSGAVTNRLQIDCGAWVIDRVEPERLAAFAMFNSEEPGMLILAWPPDAAPPRDFELQIFGHVNVTPEQPLSLSIPRPIQDTPSSGAVVVAAEDNVAMTPRTAELTGLVAEPLPPSMTLPGRVRSPLYYRVRLDAEPKKFVADVRPRPRAVSVAARHALRVEEAGLRAEHRLRFEVVNEPVSRFQLMLGRTDAALPKVQFLLENGDEPMIPLTAKEADPGDEVGGTQWELALPEPRLGTFTIVARLLWPPASGDSASTRTLPVPLVLPAPAGDTTLIRNWLRLTGETPWRAEVARKDWRPLTAGEAEQDENVDLGAGDQWYAGPETATNVTLRWGRGGAGRAAFWVQNAWTQTWLGRSQRRDRSVWRLTAQEDRVEIQLPRDADVQDLVAAVDGAEVAPDVTETGVLRLAVPVDGHEHVVEVTCYLPSPATRGGVMTLELPRLLNANSAPRFLWQLITPRDQHLWDVAGELNPETRWGWRHGFWERQATWNQADLERWAGAAEQPELPAETNQYLFSAVGIVSSIELKVMPRSTLVFTASAVALLIGLLFLYVRSLRHPLAFGALGVVALASVATWPEAAALAVQATLLGWALTFLARLLQGHWARRAPPVVARVQRSSIQRAAALPRVETPEVGELAPATTATAAPTFPSASSPKA